MAANYPPVVVDELQKIERDLGGRAQLVGMLSLAPLTPDLRYTLGMLGDPQSDGKSLAHICAEGNILPGELLKQLASAALLRGKVLASQSIGDGIAAVTRDVMKKAAPYEDLCHACRGIGTITPDPTPDQPNPSPETCDTCLGLKRLLYQPDLERQKLAIEMAQLLPKSGGINIAQINAASGGDAGSGGMGSLEALQALTDQILYERGGDARTQAPIDAEFTASPAAAESEGQS